MLTKFLLLLFLKAYASPSDKEGPTIKTPLGSVQGRYIKSYEGRTVSTFEGIPYATPPVGKLRFRDTQPVEPWSSTIVANTSYICIQFVPILTSDGIMGTEDCLYLYIYVPREEITGNENLDVVVHIHGGAFMLGAPKFLCGPDFIMDKDVVYVNFNYRLGIFGFLSTEDEAAPGNFGLKDQVMALRWIKDNIKHFGGNPESVTITGLSAGGASVHFHYFSPMSKGLFNRGFSQSGTALNMWALTENALGRAQQLGASLNCSKESTKDMIECLREVPDSAIIKSLKQFLVFISAVPFTPFGPIVEKGPNPFLPDHPYKLLLDGKINDYPWVSSNTKEEGIYPVGCVKLEEFDKRWDELMPSALDYNYTVAEEDKVVITQKMKEFYLKNETLSMDNIHKLIAMFTDRLFLIDGEKALRLQAKVSKSPIYYYFFDYDLVMKTIFSRFLTGPAHSDDGRLLFPIIGNAAVLSETDLEMKNIFTDFMYTFATKGVPTFNGIEWTPIDDSPELNYMRVGKPNEIKMQKIKELAPTDFWKTLPINENERLYK